MTTPAHPDPERPPPEPPEHPVVLRPRLLLATILLSLAIFVGFALAAYGFSIAHRNAQDINQRARHDRLVLCQAQDKSNTALRQILQLSKSFSKSHGGLSPEEQQFYARALQLAGAIDCRKLLAGGA